MTKFLLIPIGLLFMQGVKAQKCVIGVPALDPHIRYKGFSYYSNKEQKKEYLTFFKAANKTSPYTRFRDMKTVEKVNTQKMHYETLMQNAPSNPYILLSLHTYIYHYTQLSRDLSTDYADFDLPAMVTLNDFWEKSLALEIPEKSKTELRKERMYDFWINDINDSIDSRLDYLKELENESNAQKGSETDQQWLALKKARDADFKATSGFIPNHGFFGLNFGYVGYSRDSVNYFHGLEVSYDRVFESNPLNNFFRFSPFGIAFTRNLQKNQSELLVKIAELKNFYFLRANVMQFGLNSGVANQAKLFYRPEIGIDVGVMGITYGYNLTFDKAYRDLMGKHQLLISFSYPLIRLGKYK